MKNNRKGFTLLEVLVAVLIFVIGILSVAALGALNYMFIRVNSAQAKLHIYTESVTEDTQRWFREASITPGPTHFEDVWLAGHNAGDILRSNTTANFQSTVVYVSQSPPAALPSDCDARINIRIISTGASGEKQLSETTDFWVSNYRVGE